MAKNKEYEELKDVGDFGIDLKNRIIQITGEIISHKSLEYLDIRLTLLEKARNKPITIKVNSPGGCLYESMAMAGRVMASPCYIITDVTGIAMSGALSILAAGDERRASHLSTLMHHQVSAGVVGTRNTIQQFANDLHREDARRMKFLAERSNKPAEWWESVCKGSDYYMSPEEALSIDLVQEVYGWGK